MKNSSLLHNGAGENIKNQPTFKQTSLLSSLSWREDGFDEDAHLSSWRVRSSHDTEAQGLLAHALVEHHRMSRGHQVTAVFTVWLRVLDGGS